MNKYNDLQNLGSLFCKQASVGTDWGCDIALSRHKVAIDEKRSNDEMLISKEKSKKVGEVLFQRQIVRHEFCMKSPETNPNLLCEKPIPNCVSFMSEELTHI
jgi:hypothetical protein